MAYLLICPYLQGRMSKLLAIAAFLFLPVALARVHLLEQEFYLQLILRECLSK